MRDRIALLPDISRQRTVYVAEYRGNIVDQAQHIYNTYSKADLTDKQLSQEQKFLR